ncbi:hypothetical protein M413DRAFT_32867 [Hebeloma cylindrosporum]|uniref:Uncharacterized protein n=1 Tax=Hebeloma cylindrosporum TaxID=76867 RepID=A0A0C3BDT4_HEBCY|nr:hypothetical protein M413DRAFT_32867 [Hebeloma cylindrosporum h7]
MLRHKSGVMFGPDGLFRHLPQSEDKVYPNPFEEGEDPGGPPEVVIADPTEPVPIPIEEFRDKINPRGGYFQGIAQEVHDFESKDDRMSKVEPETCCEGLITIRWQQGGSAN